MRARGRKKKSALRACFGAWHFRADPGQDMGFIAGLPESSQVVFDHAIPRSSMTGPEAAAFDALAAHVAAAGEPFQLFFEPEQLAARLRAMGFRHIEDLDAAEINARYFSERADGLDVMGRTAHLISARV